MSETPQPKWMTWTGRALTALPSLGLVASAAFKLMQGPEIVDAFVNKMGLPLGAIRPIGAVELLCVVIYLVPQTAVLGAALLTGYLGGAVATHVHVGDGFVAPIVFGVALWGGLFLREPRLRALFPLRRAG